MGQNGTLSVVHFHDFSSCERQRFLDATYFMQTCILVPGMKGIIACEVLKKFEAITGKKICESFDLICGVSTGAIIASFLGKSA